MVYRRRKSRRSRKSARRRNPSRRRGRSKSRARRGRKHTHWKRIRSHKRRVNPFFGRSRRRSRSRRRRNPSTMRGLVPSKSFVMQAVGIIGGFFAAGFVEPYYAKIPGVGDPNSMVGKVAPGLLNLVLGAFVAKQRMPIAKSVGVGIAAKGAASLISNLTGLHLGADLPAIAGDSGMVRIGDDVVRVGADLGGDDGDDGRSVYEMI